MSMQSIASSNTEESSDTLTKNSVAQELAKRIFAFRYEDLPEEAIFWAKQAIIDTIACIFAGASEPSVRIPTQIPGIAVEEGPCLIFGTRQRTTALDAALINGIASHALDYDDMNFNIGGHPSIPLVAPILALGEMYDIDGRELLTAYVAGFETETKIAKGVNFTHYDKGWHPTSTLGIFGTTAAAAHIMGLDQQQTATALAIAVSFASGVKANFGTMTKPLHIGHSVRNGIFAAFLAQNSYTASPHAFEHKQGFFEVFNGPGTYDIAQIFDTWANPLDLVDPGVNLKQFPCCGSTHVAIVTMLKLRETHHLTPDMVSHIQIHSHPRRLPHTNRPTVSSGLEAKFSVQYATACALVHGTVALEHFEKNSWSDPQVQALMEKTSVAGHDSVKELPWGAEVIVKTTDGRSLSAKTEYLLGRGKENPMSPTEMWVKFEDCVSRVLSDEQTTQLFTKLHELENFSSLRELTTLCEPR